MTPPFSSILSTFKVVIVILFLHFLNVELIFAQSEIDSLYNPFPLENANLPYDHMKCDAYYEPKYKLTKDEVFEIVNRIFTESGIPLNKNVRYEKDNVNVLLDGYNPNIEIGFLYLDIYNIDYSCRKKHNSYWGNGKEKLNRLRKNTIKWHVKKLHDNIEYYQLSKFLNDKEKYVSGIGKYGRSTGNELLKKQLTALDPKDKNAGIFKKYIIQSSISTRLEKAAKLKGKHTKIEMFNFLNDHVKNLYKKEVLFIYADHFQLKKSRIQLGNHANLYQAAINRFHEIKNFKSKKKAIKEFTLLMYLYGYDCGVSAINQDLEYQSIKHHIIQSYPSKQWMNKTKLLDEYYENKYHISLEEALKINQNNNQSKRFILPICVCDKSLNVSQMPKYNEQKAALNRKAALLKQEFDEKNGITQSQLHKQKSQAYKDLYKWLPNKYEIKALPNKSERDSMMNVLKTELKKIDETYRAVEKLTDEEKEAYDRQLEAIRQEISILEENENKALRIETIKKLEEKIKTYINWARFEASNK